VDFSHLILAYNLRACTVLTMICPVNRLGMILESAITDTSLRAKLLGRRNWDFTCRSHALETFAIIFLLVVMIDDVLIVFIISSRYGRMMLTALVMTIYPATAIGLFNDIQWIYVVKTGLSHFDVYDSVHHTFILFSYSLSMFYHIQWFAWLDFMSEWVRQKDRQTWEWMKEFCLTSEKLVELTYCNWSIFSCH